MSAIQKRLKKMEVRFDEEEFVVVDMGTGTIKAGYSGEDLPRVVIPTVMAEKEIEIDQGQAQQVQGDQPKKKFQRTFGAQAFASRADHELTWPIQRGIIVDYDKMELILGHIFDKELGIVPRDMNVLLTDCPLSTKDHKMKIATMMFETFKVKSLALQNTAVLSLFSTGTTTGLVAECGEGVTYTVPVFEGYALPHAMHNINVAGGDITLKLIKELQDCDAKVTLDHYQYIQELKEQMCHVSQDYSDELNQMDDPLTQEQRSYELPDSNTIIEVNHHKRITAAECLFDPSKIDVQMLEFEATGGIAQLAWRSIEKCDSDLRINLYNNIVLAGGTTLMKRFPERFDYELRKLAAGSAKTDINISAALHRKYAAWVGGSMLASFSTFGDMTIKLAEYQETTEGERSLAILKKTIY